MTSEETTQTRTKTTSKDVRQKGLQAENLKESDSY